MKILNVLVLIFVLHPYCIAQTRTITGRIIDSENQKPVYNASVIILGTTYGTFTNFLGYFQIELAKDYDKLRISHIGYQASQIQIPEVDNFSVKITPTKQILKSLHLNSYPKEIKNTEIVLNIENTNNLNIAEENAQYLNGWNEFYQKLGNLIVNDSTFIKGDFNTDLEFVITSEGTIDEIELSPDTVLNKAIILKSILKLNNWKPAIQNNLHVDQFFFLNINYTNISEIFTIVDVNAEPREGYQEFYRYISKNLTYPLQARRMNVEGKVYVQFVVLKDGKLSEVIVIKGIGGGCDEEAVRVVSSAPKWHPALQKNNPVNQRIILPITFSLGQQKNFKDDSNHSNSKILKDPYRTTIVVREKATSPKFQGGHEKLLEFLKKNQREISDKLPPNKSGDKVQVEFVVDKKGKIGDILVKKSLGKSFDKETLRLYSIMPNWIPAELNGVAIDETIIATVYFGVVNEYKRNAAYTSFNRGLELYSEGKFEKSLTHFSKAIENHPSQLDYYFNRAVVNIELGRIDKGCEDLEFIKTYDQESLVLYKEHCSQ